MTEPQATEERQPVRFLTITSDDQGQRVDNWLLHQWKGLPKSRVYRLLRKGEVRINKKRVKPEQKLQEGDIVRLPPVHQAIVAPNQVSQNFKQMLLDAFIYEDDNLIVLNKPSGIAVHGGSGIHSGVIEGLRQLERNYEKAELVHRLDRDTSGCLMIAKNRKTLRFLHEKLRARKGIEKRYIALVRGKWPRHCMEVDAPLMKNHLQSGERMVKVDQEGQKSVTRFSVRERFSGMTLIEAEPVTGRTHQIRVHAAHRGHPIAGDNKYGDEDFDRMVKADGVQRLFLHAESLLIPTEEGVSIKVEAPLEASLEKALNKFRSKI